MPIRPSGSGRPRHAGKRPARAAPRTRRRGGSVCQDRELGDTGRGDRRTCGLGWLTATSTGSRPPLTLRADRRRPLQPHLPGRPTPPAVATPSAGPRWATCCPRPTTWDGSTASSPRSGHRRPGARGLRAVRRPRGQRRPFYVMELRRGHILRDEAAAARARRGGPAPRRRVTRRHPGRAPRRSTSTPSVSATSAAQRGLHRPPAQALARPVRPSAGGGPPGPAVVDRVHDLLAARIPEAGRPPSSTATTGSTTPWSADDGTVRAVLDWEICTLGDPLADLGLLLVYWAEPETSEAPLSGVAPTTAARVLQPRPSSLARYAARSGAGPVRASTTTWRSASGSWPASSRASTPATRAGRRPATGATSTSSPSRSAGWASAPWPRGVL